jgi:hypothetical protein
MPDLAVCLAWVTLFCCLILWNGPRNLFRDSDTGWHIRTGERILDTRSLPRTDPYSFTRRGQPWFAWEWASDLAAGVANRWAGLSGVVVIFALAIAAVSWVWVQLNWAVGGNFFLTCLFAAPMLSTTNMHWLARPHIFGWICLLGCIWYFETVQPYFGWRQSIGVTLAAVLWTNVHASFFLFPLMAILYATAHLARPLIWNLDALVERQRAHFFLLVAAVSFTTSLLNPYGLDLHRHLLAYLADSELLDRVGEFQSFNFHVEGSLQILLTLGLAAAGGILALTQKKLEHFLLTVLFLAGALRHARGLPVAALVLLPLSNGAITSALRRVREIRPNLRHALVRTLQYSDRLRLLDSRFSGLVWSPFVALAVFGWLKIPLIASQTGFSPTDFPVYAAGELALLSPEARILAPDKYGGYLIYRYDGKLKVFFDGRSDFYGSGFMKEYIRLVEVRPGWRETLDRFEFTHALLPVNYSLVPALEQIGWKYIYGDDVAVLLAAPSGSGLQPGH